MGFELLDKRIASDAKEHLAEDPQRRPDADDRVRREPGRLSRIYELLGTQGLEAQAVATATAPRGTPVPFGESDRSPFDEFRVAGLRDVVYELARVRGRHGLLEPTLNAVDPQLMARPHLPTDASPAAGRAMWRVAERRAATLYRHAVDEGTVAGDDPVVEEALARCGNGAPLEGEIRRKMEALLGVRLDRVRIHTDAVAQDAARAVRAQAFTVGEDIFFGANKYAPDSKEGQKLLAHELQHVVQAWQGRTTNGAGGVRVSDPNESLEHEAEKVAQKLDRPERRPVSGVAGRAAVRPQSRFAPTGPSRSMLLRKAEAAATGDKHDKKFTLTTNVARNKGAEQAHKAAHKVHKDDVKGAIASFRDSVHTAKAKPLEAMKHSLDAAHKVDHRGPLQRAASHAKKQGKDHEHQAHEHAKKHKNGKHDAAHKHGAHDAAHNEGDHAGAHDAVQWKPISNWDKYMPAPLPDQDEREKKRILKLVQKKINADRKQSKEGFEQLKKAQIKQAAAVRALQPGLVAKISGAQASALGQVSAAEAAQAAAIQATVAAMQGQVRGAAAAAKGQVVSAHAAAVAQIQAATTAANTKLETGQAAAIAQIDVASAMELVQVAMKFLAAKSKITALGARKEGEASALGGMSLPYSGDKLKAAKQAAEQVAEQYAAAMPENASDAANELGQEQPKTEAQVRELADKQKQTVKEQYQKAKAAVQKAHTGAMQSANEMKTQTLQLIDQTSATSCAQLSALGASQVAAVHGQASSAKAGISAAGKAAISGVISGVAQAASGIMGGAKGLVEGAKHIETPDPELTDKQVKHKAPELAKGVHGIAAGLNKSADSAAAGMSAQAAGAAKGMAATAAAAKASATQMAAGAKQTMTQAASGAADSLKDIAKGHKQTTEQITDSADDAFKNLVQATTSAYDKLNGKLDSGLDGAISNLEGKFNQAVPGQEKAKILEEAAKAAAKVKNKPWWQKALAVVVSVIVTVVVTVALTAVLGPLGPVLAAVIAGAIAGALGKIAENLVLGNKWSTGVGEAALLGGISGGISAGFASGAGALASKFATSESSLVSGVAGSIKGALVDELGGLGNWGIRAGTGFVGDQLGDIGSQLIVNHKYEFDMKNVVGSVLINSATGSKKFIDISDHVKETSVGKKVNETRIDLQDDIKEKITGKKSESGEGHDNAQGEHNNASSHDSNHGDNAHGDHQAAKPGHDQPPPSGHDAAKPAPKHEPAPSKPTHETRNQELGHDEEPTPGHGEKPTQADKPAHDHSGDKHAAHDNAGDKHAAHDDKHAAHDDKHAAHDDKHAAHDDGGDKHAAHDKAPTGDKPAEHPAQHADKAHEGDKHEHAADKHGKHDGDDKHHDAHDKHEAHDKHAKGDDKHHKGGDKHEHDGGPQGGEHEGSAHESHEDAELDDVGYHEGTEAAAHQAIEQIDSGRAPAKDKVRDTAKNEQGRKDLEKLASDPDIEPVDRQQLHHDIANDLRAKEHPTGDLARDVKETLAKSDSHEAESQGHESEGHESETEGGDKADKADKADRQSKPKKKGKRNRRHKTPIRNRPKGPRSRGRKPGKH